jgi:RNA polymerase sigma-70 factor (ECF subfamily)
LRDLTVLPDVEPDESRVVAAAANGDERAFRELVEFHYDGCLRYAMRMLGNRFDAEDVVQEVFVRVYRGLRSYQEQGHFRAWLFRILVNQCRSANGGSARREVLVPVSDTTEFELAVHDEPAGPALRDVQLALASLPSRLREAFILKFVEGWSYEEMKKLTGASESALKMRVARAKDALREALQEADDERA